MKFYNRKQELEILQKITNSSRSELVYFLGRRRIGKTSLMNHFFTSKNQKYLYFFVSNKKEWNLLQSFSETLKEYLGYDIHFHSIREFLKFLFEYGKEHPWLCVVFDEFQNFTYVDESIFDDFQEFWDKYKEGANIKLFVIGSLFTLMEDIFQSKKSPLFGRATAKIDVQEFEVVTLKNILSDYDMFSSRNLLDIYTLFGGVPKYLEVLDTIKPWENLLLETILSEVYLTENSMFLREWSDLLLTEFGKTSSVYFSILEAIANGYNKRSEIADYTKMNYDSLGLYLENLEKVYHYIEKLTPIIAQKTTLNRYKIQDNFLIFWFRYIYKNSNLLEIKKYTTLKDHILADITSLQWFAFEKLVKDLLITQNITNRYIIDFESIGNYWDKSGNEIDLICLNSRTKEVVFVECKLSGTKITGAVKQSLIAKSENIPELKDYKKYYQYYSLDNLEELF